jgi:nitrogen fixation-related uncharacterized protein
MTAGRLTVSDVFMRVVATGIALTGIAIAVGGVALFWGPMRQVLAGPVVVAMGVMAYIGGRALWWTVDQDVRART